MHPVSTPKSGQRGNVPVGVVGASESSECAMSRTRSGASRVSKGICARYVSHSEKVEYCVWLALRTI